MIIESKTYNGTCTCGKEHTMETELCIIESGALRKLNEYMQNYHICGYTVAVYDENTYKATNDRHPKVDKEIILNPEGLHANEHGVDMLLAELPENASVIVAVGSGTIHDISRYCAYIRGCALVSCPTAASVDGFCSSVAAMTWHGCKKTLTAVAPKIVIADLDIIKNAPIRLAKSGFGDMIGKYIALADWKIGSILTNEHYCEKIADMTLDATQSVLESASGISTGDLNAYERLMYGLLLSGLAMQMMGNSRPASGSEHHISHIIEMEPMSFGIHSDALHGEKVGVGTLLALKEYKRLCNLSGIFFLDYSAYQSTYLEKIFDKTTAGEIAAENASDCAQKITAKLLKENWQRICEVLKNLPSYAHLKALYKENGILCELNDCGVNDDFEQLLLDCAPTVRNRLTLMRLRKCITTIPQGKVIVAAHRGDRKNYPENTMPAFVSAIKHGADMIETDLHLTADGELVIMHDKSALRTTGVDRDINDMTLCEVKKLDAGRMFSENFRGVEVPTVNEFIELIKNTPLYINWEFKDYTNHVGEEIAFCAVDKLVALLEENGLAERSMFNSFDNRVLTYIYKKYGHRFPIHGQGIAACTRHEDSDVADEIMFDWCCLYANNDQGSVNKSPIEFEENFKYCTENGIAPCLCIADTLEAYQKALTLGCKMFTTNDLDACLDILKKLNAR